MTVIVAARVLILVQGFSFKVEWTAKMTHVSIKVTTLNFINWAHPVSYTHLTLPTILLV